MENLPILNLPIYKHKIKSINKNLQIMGKLNKSQWRKLSESYDIFINTTHIDNTPISVIEAMALGLPIVSTNVGGISENINNEVNGIIIPDVLVPYTGFDTIN